jgi:hypothetical protein
MVRGEDGVQLESFHQYSPVIPAPLTGGRSPLSISQERACDVMRVCMANPEPSCKSNCESHLQLFAPIQSGVVSAISTG